MKGAKCKKIKKFQPKVIIGSITSFVIATIGVIAVFFPDLFNLQKKNVNEYEIVLQKKDDFKKVWNFLKDHQGEAVKLSIGYCPDMNKARINFKNPKENYYGSAYYSDDHNQMIFQNSNFPIVTRFDLKNGNEYFLKQIPVSFKLGSFLAIYPPYEEHAVNSDVEYDLKLENVKKYNLESFYFEPMQNDYELASAAKIAKISQSQAYVNGFFAKFRNGWF